MAPMMTKRQRFWFNVWAYGLTGLLMAIALGILYGLVIGVMALISTL